MTTKVDGTNGVLQSYDYQVMTTGFSYTFAAGITNLIMNPAGTLATGTITMPASPADGMTITFSSTQTITALTVNGNSGQTVVGAPTTLTAGAVVVLVYRLSATTWITQVNTNDTGATGVPVINTFVSPGTWTKPATVKAIKVTVVGGGGSTPAITVPISANIKGSGGGGGGAAIRVYPAPSLPGPQPYTVGTAGGTSSFGVAPVTVISATGGAAGGLNTAGGVGGVGSNGLMNIKGGGGGSGFNPITGAGGSSIYGGGAVGQIGVVNGIPGGNYGGGASGAGTGNPSTAQSGGTGATGVVIVEEFY